MRMRGFFVPNTGNMPKPSDFRNIEPINNATIMNRLEKIDLIDRVGRELQSRMTYVDINVYLKSYDIDTKKETSSTNSKWVYVKELLADEPDNKIIEIANELEIEHGYSFAQDVSTADTKFWLPGYFKLFLSHVSGIKLKSAQLQKTLRSFGVSGFVAHEDIEPTKEWQTEIEKALMSMDALVAILSLGFKESNWTDQETGIAMGRDVLVIPVRKGVDPYGFIAKYQGLQGDGRTVIEVARSIFGILSSNSRTKGRIADVLVGLMLNGKAEDDVSHWLSLLQNFKGLPIRHLERIQTNASDYEIIANSINLLKGINELLRKNGMKEITVRQVVNEEIDSDVPF